MAESFEPGSLSVAGLFPTPLAAVTLAGHDALDLALTERILARRQQEPGVVASNVGGWHSSEFQSWSGPAGAQLLNAARQLVDRLTLIETGNGLTRASVNWRVTAWANISGAGDGNRAHGHPGAFWSGVYWVDDGGADTDESVGGLFEMSDPRGLLPVMYAPGLRYAIADCEDAGTARTLTPKAGMMILFPSWLIHGVTAYRGTRPRISVAFNFSFGAASDPLGT
ncbi:MAG TPA: TIGR02466 family protein [Aliidongia sp.]|uniref:TIGR02466 family protein n=1 Tax=Aliidongia sp. TaxID=1914230 RepID=UPI002DDDBC9A|nr:TIGR02466 family protein [Aliidongia sp.]HEV2676974.1 TIGR02466 family protein [Aliidongia sp.]